MSCEANRYLALLAVAALATRGAATCDVLVIDGDAGMDPEDEIVQTDPASRWELVTRLHRTLASAERHPDVGVRVSSVRELAAISGSSEETVFHLESFLLDPEPKVRRAAVDALAALGRVDRLTEMLRVLEETALAKSEDTYWVLDSIAALGPTITGPSLLMARIAAPGSRDRFVELVTLVPPLADEHVDDVLSLLTDPDEWVRLRAAQALSGVCNPSDRILFALAAAASDPDWSVRAYATTPSCRSRPDEAGLPPGTVDGGEVTVVIVD